MSKIQQSAEVHTIDLRGIAGAILALSVAAILAGVLGFATSGWLIQDRADSRTTQYGLWETCDCNTVKIKDRQDWFQAVQALTTIGLGFGAIALLGAGFYVCIHGCCTKGGMLITVLIGAICSAIFSAVGLIIFAVKKNELKTGTTEDPSISWSFAFIAIGAGFFIIVAILSSVQFFRARR